MILIWVLAGFCGLLVIIHMAHPRFEARIISAARFFLNLPPPQNTRTRFHLGNPLKSRPLYIQMIVLLLLLAALLAIRKTLAGPQTEHLGLWIVIDTSASMSSRQLSNLIRLETAMTVVSQAAANLEKISKKGSTCARLSTFDMERRDILPPTRNFSTLTRAAGQVTHRALGTNLLLIRELISLISGEKDAGCAITHLLVITDQSAPEWINQNTGLIVIWTSVGDISGNIGLTSIKAVRNPLTGVTKSIEMEVMQDVDISSSSEVKVFDPNGQEIYAKTITWGGGNTWRGKFDPQLPGLYMIRVTPGGNYTYDDEATIRIEDPRYIRIDWQLEDRSIPDLLGWIQDNDKPMLLVMPYNQFVSSQQNLDAQPTLIVGNGYTGISSELVEIRDFYESSPLLMDLNLDIAELIGIKGISDLPDFIPVLRGMNEQTWIAQRNNPPAAFVPGLPSGPGEEVERFSTTVFFNAVRWLMKLNPLQPLYLLTDPANPEPRENRIVLHEREGMLSIKPVGFGDLEQIQPVAVVQNNENIWPIWLAGAAAFFCIERLFAAFGSEKW